MNCAIPTNRYPHTTTAEGHLLNLLEQMVPADPDRDQSKGDVTAVIYRTIRFIQHLEHVVNSESLWLLWLKMMTVLAEN